ASFEVISKVSAERRNAHRAAIAHRSLPAESVGRRLAPLCSGVDFAHLNPCHLAVAAIRVALEAASEALGQGILMHVSVRLENSGNGNRHLCIVGVKPRAGRKIALGKPPGSGWGLIAQHFTKRVAKAE